MTYHVCHELGFASPRILQSLLTREEWVHWMAYFRLRYRTKKDDAPSDEAAFSMWKAAAKAAQKKEKRGDDAS